MYAFIVCPYDKHKVLHLSRKTSADSKSSRAGKSRDLRKSSFPITVIKRRFVTLVRPFERGFTWLITERGWRIVCDPCAGGPGRSVYLFLGEDLSSSTRINRARANRSKRCYQCTLQIMRARIQS